MDVKRNLLLVAAVIAGGLLLGACMHGPMHHKGMGPGGGGSVIYWCNCGADCKCNSVSTKPGNCSCGKEMAGGHVVYTEGNVVLACTCGPQCSCAIDPKDHTKCGCGKPVKRIDLTGTKLYFCNCKGSCGCNVVSDQPGTCRCGMELHQAQ
jgi:hypothetical protein